MSPPPPGQRGLGLLQAGHSPATTAAGYADQAHLTREVTALAGADAHADDMPHRGVAATDLMRTTEN